MIIQIRMLVAHILNWFEVVEFELHICTCCTSISIIMVSVTMPLKYHSCVRCVSNTVRQCIWCLTFGHYSGLCLFVRYLGSADFSVGEFDWMSLCRTQRSALIVVLIALVMCLTVGLVSSMGFCASNDWSRRWWCCRICQIRHQFLFLKCRLVRCRVLTTRQIWWCLWILSRCLPAMSVMIWSVDFCLFFWDAGQCCSTYVSRCQSTYLAK